MRECKWLLKENGCKIVYEHKCRYESTEARQKCFWFEEEKIHS